MGSLGSIRKHLRKIEIRARAVCETMEPPPPTGSSGAPTTWSVAAWSRDDLVPVGFGGYSMLWFAEIFLSQTERMAMSAGVMPEMRAAWPRSPGRMAVSFSRDS